MSEIITDETVVKKEFKSWRRRIFFTVWITYMIYYIGRTNISIAKPFLIPRYFLAELLAPPQKVQLYLHPAQGISIKELTSES